MFSLRTSESYVRCYAIERITITHISNQSLYHTTIMTNVLLWNTLTFSIWTSLKYLELIRPHWFNNIEFSTCRNMRYLLVLSFSRYVVAKFRFFFILVANSSFSCYVVVSVVTSVPTPTRKSQSMYMHKNGSPTSKKSWKILTTKKNKA